jgi:ABC-type transporter Mla maintaining outer membrane lipid asymmetry ATPase subunit MlaF
LARAVYSKLDLLVFDSPFSGLDSNVLEIITKQLFSEDGHFKQSGRSAVLVTNNCEHLQSLLQVVTILIRVDQILSHADNIIVLDKGTIFAQGSYADMATHMPHIFSKLQMNTPEEQVELQPAPQQLSIERSREELDGYEDNLKANSALVQNGSWSVYSYYIGAAGWTLFIFSQTAMVAECFSSSFSC